MKGIIIFVGCFVFCSTALAREPKAALCRDAAVEGATAIFNLNNKTRSKIIVSVELLEMDHSENGREIWDVSFKKYDLTSNPYRITLSIEGCIITGFSMPFGS
ncbi:MAG: hypothetical protein KDD35_03980 [Bdellovibrionales bacterium]|nr:hypothetical protein [Bdellovibrionales bacterium]